MTIQTSEFFYVPVTARSWGNVDFGLKSHMKGLMNRTTKHYSTMYVRPADSGSVCASTHYIKQASWIADQNVMLQSHCLSRFGQSAIEGKYDQRMV